MGEREPHVGDTGYGMVYGTEERMGRARRKHPDKDKRLFLRPGEKVEIRFAKKDGEIAFFRTAEDLYKQLNHGTILSGQEWPEKED